MRPLPFYLNPSITEAWLRQYQVFPGRTHPMMNMTGGGGYLLHAIHVYDDPKASSALAGFRRRRREPQAESRGEKQGDRKEGQRSMGMDEAEKPTPKPTAVEEDVDMAPVNSDP